MEDTILKIADQSGILALSCFILYFGGKKLDNLTSKIDNLCQLVGVQLIRDGFGKEVKSILGKDLNATLNGDNIQTRTG